VTAINSWGPTPTEKVGTEVDTQVAAPTGNENTHLAPSEHRSPKSANGRMATEAAQLNGNKLMEEEGKTAC
jgi:hypothetical protein